MAKSYVGAPGELGHIIFCMLLHLLCECELVRKMWNNLEKILKYSAEIDIKLNNKLIIIAGSLRPSG